VDLSMIEVRLQVPIVRSPRVQQVESLFDVPLAERSEVHRDFNLPITAKPWSIGLIAGPSGSGKTSLLRQLVPDAPERFDWPDDKSVLDAFPQGLPIKEIVGMLSSVGFSSPPAWLRPYRALSNGEQFRVDVARRLLDDHAPIVIDEFTSVVDRTVAQVASAAIAKAVRRSEKMLIAATCHYDVIDWLDPDWILDTASGEFRWREPEGHPPLRSSSIARPARLGGFSVTITTSPRASMPPRVASSPRSTAAPRSSPRRSTSSMHGFKMRGGSTGR
jgi:ABC-type ATPase with predicted acetyltransferase domain